MKYTPRNDLVIIRMIEEEEATPTKGIIITLDESKRLVAIVEKVGSDITFVSPGDKVIYDAYFPRALDEKEKLFTIKLDGIICKIEAE